jgi:hypothetical protein
MKLYDVKKQALRQKWELLKSVDIEGRGAQAPGAVVMCQVGGHHPYAVHFFNKQDGGFHQGNYCETLEDAEKAFAQRVLRFLGKVHS